MRSIVKSFASNVFGLAVMFMLLICVLWIWAGCNLDIVKSPIGHLKVCNIVSHNTVATLRVPETTLYDVIIDVSGNLMSIHGDISITSDDIKIYSGEITENNLKVTNWLDHKGLRGYIISVTDGKKWLPVSLTNSVEYTVEVNVRGNRNRSRDVGKIWLRLK